MTISNSVASVDLSSIPRVWRKDLQTRLEEVLSFDFSGMSDAELGEHADYLRGSGEDASQGEVFALVGETTFRVLGQRPYPVQYLAALVIGDGRIAEMGTGEGKTLTAAIVAAWGALTGRVVHVMTANDYLAERDAEWMRPVYESLGLTVGVIHGGLYLDEKASVYLSNIVYSTATQFGFDYLIDHIIIDGDFLTRATYDMAVIDEADSLLIDEARTPLIVSGEAERSQERIRLAEWAKGLSRYHYEEDHEAGDIWLTDLGIEYAEDWLGITNLYSHPDAAGTVQAALRAQIVLKNGKDYVIQGEGEDAEACLVDEGTGRILTGRRYQAGLHEALEAKEGLRVRAETVVAASITIPSFLELYSSIGGTTGTAKSSEEELAHVYSLDVVEIPPNRPRIRIDRSDKLYVARDDKLGAVVSMVKEAQSVGRPVLVGTPSVEDSVVVGEALAGAGIEHVVLNAVEHRNEASLIAQAGRVGAVTVATNMAGRGVDILLGGDKSGLDEVDEEEIAREREQVVANGGLLVIGTARHSSRRIDDQLRGRAGRQGEPGESVFLLSLDDDLLSHFANDRMRNMLGRLQTSTGEALEHKRVDAVIEEAQTKIESMHKEAREKLARLEAVVSAQRNEVYSFRERVLDRGWEENIALWWEMANEKSVLLDGSWIFDQEALEELYGPQERDGEGGEEGAQVDASELSELVEGDQRSFFERSSEVDDGMRSKVLARLLCKIIDDGWQLHLRDLEALRDGIALRGNTGQVAPMFTKDAYAMFEVLLVRILAVGVANVRGVLIEPEEMGADGGEGTAGND